MPANNTNATASASPAVSPEQNANTGTPPGANQTDEDKKKAQEQLEKLILSCAGEASPAVSGTNATQPVLAAPVLAAPDLLMIMDAGAALNALAKFFQNSQTLTREEFSLLVSKNQDRNSGRQS